MDNYVGNVYKGQTKMLSLKGTFTKNMLINKDILIKDIEIIKVFHVKRVSYET